MLKLISIIYQIGILYILSQIGMWLQQYFNLMIPGSVVGLIILFLLLTTKVIKPLVIKSGANFLVKHLVLFFIPAVVGIVNYTNIFYGKNSFLLMITMISTLILMIVSGKLVDFLERKEIDQAM